MFMAAYTFYFCISVEVYRQIFTNVGKTISSIQETSKRYLPNCVRQKCDETMLIIRIRILIEHRPLYAVKCVLFCSLSSELRTIPSVWSFLGDF